MNLATKAALLNALVFPGWGQVYLKHYKKGIVIILAVLAGILSIIQSIVQITIAILKVAPIKKGTVTFGVIFQLSMDAVRSINLYYLIPILLSLFLLWIFSIFDAYRLGKEEMTKYDHPNKSI